jgi:hypothetical protein
MPSEPTDIQPVAKATMAVADPPANDITALLDKHAATLGPDQLEKLLSLHERVADRLAAQEFARAMAAFQSECPFIPKTSTAHITTRGEGRGYAYSYAELPEICRTIQPIATKHGLSFSWDTEETADSQLLCVCIVRHINGHQVPTRFKCPIDTTAKMSGPQKSGAALTYAKRQSLIAAFGLTTCDPDDDGAGGAAAFEPIAEDQVAELEAVLVPPDFSLNAFLSHFGIENLKQLPVARHDEAWQMITVKRSRIARGLQQ